MNIKKVEWVVFRGSIIQNKEIFFTPFEKRILLFNLKKEVRPF